MNPPTERCTRCWAEVDLSALQHNARVAQRICRTGGIDARRGESRRLRARHGAGRPRVATDGGSVKDFAVANVDRGHSPARTTCRKQGKSRFFRLPCRRNARRSSGTDFYPGFPGVAEAGGLRAACPSNVARSTTRAATRSAIVISRGHRHGPGGGAAGSRLDDLACRAVSDANARRSWLTGHRHAPALIGRGCGLYSGIAAGGIRADSWQVNRSELAERHAQNSAGLLGYPVGVRTATSSGQGLMLYGSSPLPEQQARLRPALTLKTRVSLVRERCPQATG